MSDPKLCEDGGLQSFPAPGLGESKGTVRLAFGRDHTLDIRRDKLTRLHRALVADRGTGSVITAATCGEFQQDSFELKDASEDVVELLISYHKQWVTSESFKDFELVVPCTDPKAARDILRQLEFLAIPVLHATKTAGHDHFQEVGSDDASTWCPEIRDKMVDGRITRVLSDARDERLMQVKRAEFKNGDLTEHTPMLPDRLWKTTKPHGSSQDTDTSPNQCPEENPRTSGDEKVEEEFVHPKLCFDSPAVQMIVGRDRYLEATAGHLAKEIVDTLCDQLFLAGMDGLMLYFHQDIDIDILTRAVELTNSMPVPCPGGVAPVCVARNRMASLFLTSHGRVSLKKSVESRLDSELLSFQWKQTVSKKVVRKTSRTDISYWAQVTVKDCLHPDDDPIPEAVHPPRQEAVNPPGPAKGAHLEPSSRAAPRRRKQNPAGGKLEDELTRGDYKPKNRKLDRTTVFFLGALAVLVLAVAMFRLKVLTNNKMAELGLASTDQELVERVQAHIS